MKGRILLGVCGGVALYKSLELLRLLKKNGFEVKVILTPFAKKLVSPKLFYALGAEEVLFKWRGAFEHINLSRWADLFIIAPLTANTTSKIYHRLGDNLLTTTLLAYGGKVLLVPSANTLMFEKVKPYLKELEERGYRVLYPDFGELACGEVGEGRMPEPKRILEEVYYLLKDKPLKGKRVLITAGATREFIDRVRFLSNLSSGKMGISLARVAYWLGAEVTLIKAFTQEEAPSHIRTYEVSSTKELLQKTLEHMDWANILIMNSAVSDYRPVQRFEGKMKKTEERISLTLERTEDILLEVSKRFKGKTLVGFCLEEEGRLLEEGFRKLKEKSLSAIVCNPISVMGSEKFKGYLITREGKTYPIEGDKLRASEKILRLVL